MGREWMAITFLNPQKVGASAWRLTWTSDVADPTFNIYVNGVQAAEQRVNTFVVGGDYIDTHVVEVMDDGSAPRYAANNRSELLFNTDANADHYDVEHNPGSGFVKIAQMPRAGGREAMRTSPLDDASVHQFRVTPVREDGTSGTVVTVSGRSIRHADVPLVSLAYASGTGVVTIS